MNGPALSNVSASNETSERTSERQVLSNVIDGFRNDPQFLLLQLAELDCVQTHTINRSTARSGKRTVVVDVRFEKASHRFVHVSHQPFAIRRHLQAFSVGQVHVVLKLRPALVPIELVLLVFLVDLGSGKRRPCSYSTDGSRFLGQWRAARCA